MACAENGDEACHETTGESWDSLAELESLASHRFYTSYSVALVHAGLGDSDAAFASLEKAFDERSNWLVWLRLDPRWKSLLRSDARFEELVERMRCGLSKHTMRRGVRRPSGSDR